jgi:energy-coupling factor transporter ATP-binding protein EcfA2
VKPVVHLDDVSVTFQRGPLRVDVLRGVSMALFPGELGGVWGRRGSGKTTLAAAVAGMQPPSQGQVLFDNGEARGREHEGRVAGHAGFAATRHGPSYDDWTPVDWITASMVNLGLPWRTIRRRALVALDRTGIAEYADEPWAHLSDSTRALAAIAHAIAKTPRLLVIDDAVAGFGVGDRASMMELLRGFADDGMAVLITAAEMTDLRGVSRLWELDDGRLDGPPANAPAPSPAEPSHRRIRPARRPARR